MSFVGGGQFNSYDSTVDRAGARSQSTSGHVNQSGDDGIDRPSLDQSRRLTGEESTDAKELSRRDNEVHELAREITRKSMGSVGDFGEGINPVEADEDSPLNPNSPNFNAKAWAKSVMHIQMQESDRNPLRTAGVAFRNLNVFGFGTSSDYQKTVGNVWLSTFGLIRKALNIGQTRIDILNDFEGLVRAGEMLVVLGPPGSGCTTFLKTIAGEWHGFQVDQDSYLNYQGNPLCLLLEMANSCRYYRKTNAQELPWRGHLHC
jgi:ATP-binding cassette subfamily G (WHITE) protein 2 (PDR)